jgi:hypothetical protein
VFSICRVCMQNHSVRAGFALEAPSLLVSGITDKSKPSLRNFQQEHVQHVSVFVGFACIPTVKRALESAIVDCFSMPLSQFRAC